MALPSNAVHACSSCGCLIRMTASGSTISTIHSGCVQNLQPVDRSDAEEDDRDDDQRAQQVANDDVQAQRQFEGLRPDGGLDGEEDEGERGVDQRRDRRADVAEAGAARQQVDVDAGHAAPVGDRQADEKDQQRDHGHRQHRVGKAEADRDAGADGFERQKRDAAERRVRHHARRPAAVGAGGVAQCVVLQRLLGHPRLVLAPDSKHRRGRSCRARRPGRAEGNARPPPKHGFRLCRRWMPGIDSVRIAAEKSTCRQFSARQCRPRSKDRCARRTFPQHGPLGACHPRRRR